MEVSDRMTWSKISELYRSLLPARPTAVQSNSVSKDTHMQVLLIGGPHDGQTHTILGTLCARALKPSAGTPAAQYSAFIKCQAATDRDAIYFPVIDAAGRLLYAHREAAA